MFDLSMQLWRIKCGIDYVVFELQQFEYSCKVDLLKMKSLNGKMSIYVCREKLNSEEIKMHSVVRAFNSAV